jgi:hypothetical protein
MARTLNAALEALRHPKSVCLPLQSRALIRTSYLSGLKPPMARTLNAALEALRHPKSVCLPLQSRALIRTSYLSG